MADSYEKQTSRIHMIPEPGGLILEAGVGESAGGGAWGRPAGGVGGDRGGGGGGGRVPGGPPGGGGGGGRPPPRTSPRACNDGNTNSNTLAQ